MTRGCLLTVQMHFFLFSSVVLAFGLLVHGQSTTGFISVDCGMSEGSGYRDPFTNITFSPDAPYIDAGESRDVSMDTSNVPRQYQNVRSFPNTTRSCYRLWPVKPRGKYLVRAGFLYGNYDGKNLVPVFDLYIGVNIWLTINQLSSPNGGGTVEIITVAQRDSLAVCLMNTGNGTPFISTLELRPLPDSMYVLAKPSQSLVLLRDRRNYGATSQLRYPDDPYDRIWFVHREDKSFVTLTSPSEVTVTKPEDDQYEVPPPVLKTAWAPANTTDHLNIQAGLVYARPGDTVHVVMHFAEVERLAPNQTRKMDIYQGRDAGGPLLYGNYSPAFPVADARPINATAGKGGTYVVSLYRSASSTRPFIINAVESFILRPMDGFSTYPSDVDAMEDIKREYQVKRNWMGDPCAPKQFKWEGLNCSYGANKPPRITSLNLSSSGLRGGIPASIANLTALTTLDLSSNNLTGKVPDFLADLPALKLLILTGNQLNGTIPKHFCGKVQSAAVSQSIEGYAEQCSQEAKKRRHFLLPAVVIASLIFLVILVVLLLLRRMKRQRKFSASKELLVKQQREGFAQNTTKMDNGWKRESHQFTFSDILNITKNFERAIGRGGFGTVYLGYLDDGMKVAVKVLSHSSSQGIKEFRAEALLLARVHHRNLVSLLGYCDDEHNLALVYEYMDQGTLRAHLSGEIENVNTLCWEQRIRIAHQTAQGLDYLHNGCKPSIIHRDVKSTNILLGHNFEAKLADFGLSRAFNSDSLTHISTTIAGTPGYLDPRYHQTGRLTEKSDIYSFGVVLLEIITGHPPFPNWPSKTHIVQWVHSRLECGDIGIIVDTRLHGQYDVNSSWKMLDIAMSCTSKVSTEGLTMGNVVTQLKECLMPEVDCDVLNDLDMPNRHPIETLTSRTNSKLVPSIR